eukprot:8601439-Pyramimonas_sp.AAC.1
MLSGVVQGCPASGCLYGIASHPSVVHFETLVEKRGLGLSRLCADNVGSVVHQEKVRGNSMRSFGHLTGWLI